MRAVDVLIVGAGAAGLMCAIEAGQRGRSVLLLDHARKAGKKILISGGGRCNFTNYHTEPERFLSQNPHFCISALQRYSPYDFIALMEKHAIAYHEKKLGQLFCDDSAKQVVRMLLDECAQASVELAIENSVFDIQANATGFMLNTSLGTVQCESLVLATGGLSIPRMGATDYAHRVARQFGLAVTATQAALVPFTWQATEREHYVDLSGISIDVEVSCNGTRFREQLLFTHRGLSGPAMLQISSYWHRGDSLVIDLLPGGDAEQWLLAAKQQRPKAAMNTCLSERLPKRFAQRWCELHAWQGSIGQYSDRALRDMAAALQHWQVLPGGTEGYRTAEVTLGGVDSQELSSKTMETKKVDGLYFIGECIDVTGWLGGYNFQWAWASGWCAGQYA